MPSERCETCRCEQWRVKSWLMPHRRCRMCCKPFYPKPKGVPCNTANHTPKDTQDAKE